jgi:N-acetyl-gamma-glutamyl-phosphate reductase
VSDASQQPLEGKPAARVLVAGASGYAGALAAELLWRHPRLELARVTARSEVGTPLRELYPRYSVPLVLEELDPDSVEGIDAAVVGYPHGAAATVVAELRQRRVKVVDLSADFRLRDPATYSRWYGEHPAPQLLDEAVYGLTELHREPIAEADLVANPGCYPTAALLALAPLAADGLVRDLVVDAKSGVSGAGRGAAERMRSVVESDDSMAYGVAGHRHQPEIAQELGALGSDGSLTFVPHLLPFDQGELVSCYASTSRQLDQDELTALYEERYADEPFVELVDQPPGVGEVRETNLCRIHVVAGEGRAMAFAAIDNLWKGASAQAIQNLNLMLGMPEEEGIS